MPWRCRPQPLDPNVTGSEQSSIDTVDIDIIGFQVTLDLRVSDVNNNLASVVIEWGDGTGDIVTSGFGDIDITDGYPDLGDYTIRVEATDDLEVITIDQSTASVTLLSGDLLGQYLCSDGNAEDSSRQGNDGIVFPAANCVLRTAASSVLPAAPATLTVPTAAVVALRTTRVTSDCPI